VFAAYVVADAAARAWVTIDAGLSALFLGNLAFRTPVQRVEVRATGFVRREHAASAQPAPDRRACDVKVRCEPADDLGRIAAEGRHALVSGARLPGGL
jgi:hypothetical protein